MKRTDRILIYGALLLLLLSVGAFYGDDWLFGRGDRATAEQNAIAVITQGSGDVRARFKDEMRWQRVYDKQKLIYDDSIFAGKDSKIKLRVGNSDLDLDQNTMIVLRKQDLFNTLSMNYGGFKGLIRKGDTLVVESNGERVHLAATENSRVVIGKKNDAMTIQLREGAARMMRDGHVRDLTVHDTVKVEKTPPAPLEWVRPDRVYHYSNQEKVGIELRWRRAIGQSDGVFTLETATEPTFRTLSARETLKGDRLAHTFARGSTFVRVRDDRGATTPVREVHVAQPAVPVLRTPQEDTFEAPANFTLSYGPLDAGARLQVQIAADAGFTKLTLDRAMSTNELPYASAPADLYARARFVYDADQIQGAWSTTKRLHVREPLDLNRMARAGMPYDILIPNKDYPHRLFGAKDAEVQGHLRTLEPLPRFFDAYLRKGYTLVTGLRGQPESERPQTTPEFPPEWIRPGRVDVTYRIEANGQTVTETNIHRVRIALEAPNRLRGDERGRLSWSPLLFARGYEGELRDDAGEARTFKTKTPNYAAAVEPGRDYAFRVRALDASGKALSDWSDTGAFHVPLPPAQQFVEIEPEPAPAPTREPAQTPSLVAQAEARAPSWMEKIGAWFWAGTGINYVQVKQSISSTADVEYHNTKAGSLYLEAGYLGRLFGGIFSYKRTPGDVRTDDTPVDRRDFIWSTYSIEALLRLPWRGLASLPIAWALRAGVQEHTFPFLHVGTGKALIQGTNGLSTASLGFMAETLGRWRYHWFMRYQQPFRSQTEGGNQFSISPVTTFDGSIGTSYHLTEHFKTGLFFYGQMHNYKFTYSTPTQTSAGTQWLFYSNAEMRLGYDF